MIFIFLFLQPLIEMEATVDKREITVGDPIKYEALIKIKDAIQIKPPEIEKIGNFEIMDKKIEKEEKSVRLIYTITTFETGEDTIPHLAIKCIGMDGEEWEAATEPISIKVKSILPPGIQDIQDIKSPVSLPRNLLRFYIGILLLATAGTAGWLLYKRKKKLKIEERAPPRPAHEIAYERLDLLKLEDGKIKEYYIELSDIIRRYIEGRYKISAPTQTTFELYRELRRAKVGYTNIEVVKDFLSSCDMVKFAKYIPPRESIKRYTKTAKEIVDKTKTFAGPEVS